MPSNESLNGALAALGDKKLPILGVKIGDRVVEPGLHIPKGGEMPFGPFFFCPARGVILLVIC